MAQHNECVSVFSAGVFFFFLVLITRLLQTGFLCVWEVVVAKWAFISYNLIYASLPVTTATMPAYKHSSQMGVFEWYARGTRSRDMTVKLGLSTRAPGARSIWSQKPRAIIWTQQRLHDYIPRVYGNEAFLLSTHGVIQKAQQNRQTNACVVVFFFLKVFPLSQERGIMGYERKWSQLCYKRWYVRFV